MLRNYQAGTNNDNRGSGSSIILVYLALVSISSVAFATVKLKAGEEGSETASAISQSDIATNRKLVQLTKYRGQIYRDDGSETVQSGFDGNTEVETLWNPLAKVWLTDEQTRLMKTAFDIGYEDGGLEHAQLIQGVLLQETIAGLMGRIGHMTAPVGKRSYGVMQVKVSAASDVLRRHVKLGRFKSAEEIIASLIIDDVFNIRVASKHLLHLRSRTKTDEQALMAYNIGLRASRRYKRYDNFRYVKKVKRYMEHLVSPFNEKFHNSVLTQNGTIKRTRS